MILALVIGSFTGDSEPTPSDTPNPQAVLSFSGPPRADVDAAPCAKVLARLPVSLGRLHQRVVHIKPDTPFVVAWGEPPVVLRCGEQRPKDLRAGSSAEFLLGGNPGGPYYDIQKSGDGNVWTTVDRAAYVSVTIPSKYQGADIMPPLSVAIAKGLPAVCSTDPATKDLNKLCTRRK